MKKKSKLLFGVFALFGLTMSVSAADKYELKDIELSEKNKINYLIQSNDKKDGFLANGAVGGDEPNVYNVTLDGIVSKTNKYYYNIDKDYYYSADNTLSGSLGKKKVNIKEFTDEKINLDDIYWSYSSDEILDETRINTLMYCPKAYDFGVEDGAVNNEEYNYPRLGDIDVICAVYDYSPDEIMLIKQGHGARVLLDYSNEYENAPDGIIINNISVILRKKNNAGYITAAPDGTIGEFDDTMFELVQGSNVNNLEAVGSYNGKVVYKIDKDNKGYYIHDGKVIGTYSSDSYYKQLSNGLILIVDNKANKIYNLDESIFADKAIYGYGQSSDNVTIMTYVKNGKLIFFDGKDIIYQTDYDESKYPYLVDYQMKLNDHYYFLAPNSETRELSDKMVILAKKTEEEKKENAEEKVEEVEESIKYEILEGNDQTFDTKGKDALKFKVNIPYDDFKASGKVYLDGELVDSKNYTITEDTSNANKAIVITFNQDYSKGLKDRKHTILVVTDLGEVKAEFKSVGNPKTLDSSLAMFGLFSISLCGVYITSKRIGKAMSK